MISHYTVNIISAKIYKKKVLSYKTFIVLNHSGYSFTSHSATGSEPYWNHTITLNEKASFAHIALVEKGIFSEEVIAEGIVMLKSKQGDWSNEANIPLFSYDKKIADVLLRVEDLVKSSLRQSRKISKLPSNHPLPQLKSARSDLC